MITFSIDGNPLTKDINQAVDYNSKVVYSAITDTLVKYDYHNKKYVNWACKEIKAFNNYKKHVVNLREDLFFDNGQKVTPSDYVDAIEKIKKNNPIVGETLKNIKRIKVTQNTIIFFLKKTDSNFNRILSQFNISPFKDGLTSGPYKINSVDKSSITLEKNHFYRIKVKNNKIKFIIDKDVYAGFHKYINNEIDITNNTMFPFDEIDNNVIVEPSYIFLTINFNLKMLQPEKRLLRKAILHLINRENLVKKMPNIGSIANDFFLENYDEDVDHNFNLDKGRKLLEKTTFKKEISLGYSDYYPNEIIAKEIKKMLEKEGLLIKIVKWPYGIANNSTDMNLLLNNALYFDNNYFYESYYFRLLIDLAKKNHVFVRIYSYMVPKSKEKDFFNKIIFGKALKIPLLKMNSIYLKKDKLKRFHYNELNFWDL